MFQTCIIGAGISGLAHAWELHRNGNKCLVLETSATPGGAICSHRSGPYLAEQGPHSIHLNSPAVDDFLRSVPDLQASLIESRPEAKKRFVLRRGKLHAVPMNPLAALISPLWSIGGKLRALKEPFIKAAPADRTESIADFARRRLGDELYRYAVNPMVAGIYAGDPETLSLQHTFPKLHTLEQTHGSLLRGMLQTRKNAHKNKQQRPPARILSCKNGMAELPGKLAAALGESVQTGVTIDTIQQAADHWTVHWTDANGSAHEHSCTQLILTVPAHRLATLPLEPPLQAALKPLDRIPYPPVSVLTLGFKRADVAHPLDGFGFLVPESEPCSLLGVLFPSSIFPGRAPEDEVLLAAFIGGARRPELATADTAALQTTVLPELEALLGIRGAPTFIHHKHWERAIPQYELDYATHQETMNQIENNLPGLKLAGNYRTGVSVTACIEAATVDAASMDSCAG